MQTTQSRLEKILGEVRKEFTSSKMPRFSPPSKHAKYGLCGFAARRVVQKLLATGFPREQVRVYTFWCHSDPCHTLAALVPSYLKDKFGFNETWRIDPIVEEKNTKHLYAPGDSYWIEDIPKINADMYFFKENKSCIKLRLTNDKLKFIYDHVKDPPSYIIRQTAVSRSTVTGYRYILKTLELMLSNNPAKEKDIIKKFGKCYHNSVRTWLDFLVQKGVYKVEGEENDRVYSKTSKRVIP